MLLELVFRARDLRWHHGRTRLRLLLVVTRESVDFVFSMKKDILTRGKHIVDMLERWLFIVLLSFLDRTGSFCRT